MPIRYVPDMFPDMIKRTGTCGASRCAFGITGSSKQVQVRISNHVEKRNLRNSQNHFESSAAICPISCSVIPQSARYPFAASVYRAIRKEKDKQKFYAAYKVDFIINDAAKRQLDKLGAPKQLPKRKEVVAEIQSLISKKNECYNDYREESDLLHELMTMQRNYQMAMQPQQPKHGRKHEQEL